MKFSNGGYLKNQQGEQKNIVVNSPMMKPHDWFVGLGLIVGGIFYLTTKSFKGGAEGFEKAEYDTMVDLGIIKD